MKWEYKIVHVEISGFPAAKMAQKAAGELNALGAEGWEAVSTWTDVLFTVVLMKRPIPR
jgi:hypothetical protein